MFDDMYGGPSSPAPEFKTCKVCGLVDCEEHAQHPLNDTRTSEEIHEEIIRFSRAIVEAFAAETGADVDEALAALEKKGDALLHTGAKNQGNFDEEQEEEVTEEDEEETEAEDEEEDATVQKFTKLPPPVSTLGGDVRGLSKKEDKDKANVGEDFYHLDHVKDLMTTSAWRGTPHQFRMFRAKHGIGKERVERVQEEANKLSPRLKQQLYLALEAEARVARQRNQTSGSVDPGQASKLVTDAKSDIFAKKAHRKEISTAVVIMLDDSGSMREIVGRGSRATGGLAYMNPQDYLYTKAGAAALMAMMLGDVLTQLNVTFGIYSYESSLQSPFYEGEGGKKVRSEWGGHFAIQYKGLGEAWAVTKDRMGAYLPHAGYSLTYEAASYGASLLLNRKEDRKILFHLSDAQAGNTGMVDLPNLVKTMEQKAKIRYVGFGLLEDSFKKYMKDHAETIDRIEDLNDAVFRKLADLIHPQR